MEADKWDGLKKLEGTRLILNLPCIVATYPVNTRSRAVAKKALRLNRILCRSAQCRSATYLASSYTAQIPSLSYPSIYRFHHMTRTSNALGPAAIFVSLEHVKTQSSPITSSLTVSFNHTKHATENLHLSISIFHHLNRRRLEIQP